MRDVYRRPQYAFVAYARIDLYFLVDCSRKPYSNYHIQVLILPPSLTFVISVEAPRSMELIAIIGLSFRLPDGVEDVLSFWDMLENGRNVMKEWPRNRTNIDTFYKPGSGFKNTASLTETLPLGT